jgi:DNA-binding NtrC family response regulator
MPRSLQRTPPAADDRGVTRPPASSPPPGPAPCSGRTSSLPKPRWARAPGFRVVGGDVQLPLLADRPVIVGTASAADLRVVDDFVSGRHLRLTADTHAVRVEDLGSKNGTWVDGVLVDRAWVRAGATIRVGRLELRVQGAGESVQPETPPRELGAVQRLLGRSAAMRSVRERLVRLAPLSQPVLVCGETGTGKELAARVLHEHGERCHGPFVPLNCGSIPEQLAESALFGHRRGAFTGAERDHPGAFGRASGGTLFLDEIGELPPLLQAKLLRALETGEVLPVGAERETRVDVRIVAATHRDLPRMVVEGRMRADLYHRLAVLTVELPPLRDRREDIPELVAAFGAMAECEMGRPLRLSAEAIRAAQSHAWAGNVRALRNAVQRAVALGEARLVPDFEVPGLEIPVSDATSAREAIEVPRGDFETMKRALLRRVVAEAGSIRQAAIMLGVPRSTLGAWLAEGDG